MVRDVFAYRQVRLGGADVHPTIDLRRVDADDLGTETLRERDGQCALPCRRRAHQQDGGDHDLSRFIRKIS